MRFVCGRNSDSGFRSECNELLLRAWRLLRRGRRLLPANRAESDNSILLR
jgi:hypothetical protein